MINREKKLRNPILRLKIPESNPPQYERDSSRMAQLARRYHEDLQKLDIVEQSEAERTTDIKNTLKEILEQQQMEDLQRSMMNRAITPDQVQMAIHLAKNNTATRMDRCPYEL